MSLEVSDTIIIGAKKLSVANFISNNYCLGTIFNLKIEFYINSFMTEVPIIETNPLIYCTNQSMDWFLYDRDLRIERVNSAQHFELILLRSLNDNYNNDEERMLTVLLNGRAALFQIWTTVISLI